jgi:hypothetical protein
LAVLDFVPRWVLVWSLPLLFAAGIVLAALFSLVGLPADWAVVAIAFVLFPCTPLAILWYRRTHGLERPDDGMPVGRLDSLLRRRR